MALDSPEAEHVVAITGIGLLQKDSVALISMGQVYTKTDAIIELGKQTGGIWRICTILKLVPRDVRNFFYDFVAKNRYRWFGKSNKCAINKRMD